MSRISLLRPLAGRGALAFAAALVFLLPLPLAGQWTATPLGFTTWVGGIVNNSGQVAGWGTNPAAFRPEAIRFDPVSGVEYLGALTATSGGSYGYAINNAGTVAGYSSDGSYNRATRFDPSGPVNVWSAVGGGAGNSMAYAINDVGDIAGRGRVGGVFQAFWSDGTSLHGVGGSFAYALNDAGQVAGYAWNGSVNRPFLDDGPGGDPVAPLDEPGHGTGLAYDLNDAGLAVGYSHDGYRNQAFVSDGTGLTFIGSQPGAYHSVAYGISDGGVVVGQDQGKGVLWQPNGSGYDQVFLDALVGGGWTFTHARGISDDGRHVVAFGSAPSQSGYDFVLLSNTAPTSTVPEPGTVVLMATGLAGLGVAARRRRDRSEGTEA